MSGAAPAGTASEQALAALRWDWGEFYLIGYDDEHGWWAARRDRIGALLTEEGPGELRAAMADDYGMKPVKPNGQGNPREMEALPDGH